MDAFCRSFPRTSTSTRRTRMTRFLKLAAAFAFGALVWAATPALAADEVTPNDTARFLAGLHPSPQSPLAPLTQDRGWQQHADALNAVWANLDANQLAKIRA